MIHYCGDDLYFIFFNICESFASMNFTFQTL